MARRDGAERGLGTPARIDRILIGCCAAIWLVLLGVSVAAGVALVDLGRGFHKEAGTPHAGLLYAVIGVSALIILAAIPVLIRARNNPGAWPAVRATGVAAHRGGATPIRAGYAAPHAGHQGASAWATGWLEEAVDRIWLRGTLSLASAVGGAWVAVAAGTYLMAVGKDGAAWAGYGLAGAVTAAMPVIPWLYLRQLRQLLTG